MSQISRVKTWIAEVLKYADLNGEFNNIINAWNNMDNGTAALTSPTVSGNLGVTGNITGATITANTQLIGKGTATNDSAASGIIGQYVESLVSSPQSSANNNTWADMTSIQLTAGDWDVTALGYWNYNAATWTEVDLGISTTTGNDSTGLTLGTNYLAYNFPSTTIIQGFGLAVPNYRMSVATTTTVYLKYKTNFSAGTPQVRGRLSARRMR